VVLAADGYPASPRTGDEVHGLAAAGKLDGVEVIHAGTRTDDRGRLLTAGGRVLAVTAVGADVPDARAKAYAAVDEISFDGMRFRSDVAAAVR
jgi:phosphoribosylamine--glycine ligase